MASSEAEAWEKPPVGSEWVRWWRLIQYRYLSIAIYLLALVVMVSSAVFPVGVFRDIIIGAGLMVAILAGILFLASLFAPVAIWKERRRLSEDGLWYPSRWYYLMVFPTGVVGFILSIVYVRRRKRYYGTEPFPDGEERVEELEEWVESYRSEQ